MKLLAYYPYRKAWVRGNPVIFLRESMADFERTVAQMAKKSNIAYLDDFYGQMKFQSENGKCGNHTCFTVEMENYVIRSFMFTDLTVIMGDRVDIENW
jgi:hypothetical protein